MNTDTVTLTSQAPVESAPQSGDSALESLWARYNANPRDRAVQEELLQQYLYLVRAETSRVLYHLPSHIDRQELYAEGMVGLFAAITKFDSVHGVPFVNYARKRIWGAIVDRVRTLDGIPRSIHKASKKITQAINAFLHEHQRQPDEIELAEVLQIPVDELRELERQAGLSQMLSLDCGTELSPGKSEKTLGEQLPDPALGVDQPYRQLAAEESKTKLIKAMKSLPDRERAIVVLYYHKGLMFKEIAAAMEISESRVSQLHSRAMIRLKAFMERPVAD